MIEDTIAKIEQRLQTANTLPTAERTELEQLLAQLRREAGDLPNNSMPVSAAPIDDDAHSALSRLQETLAEFETSHPQLVGTVNRISTILSNMGI